MVLVAVDRPQDGIMKAYGLGGDGLLAITALCAEPGASLEQMKSLVQHSMNVKLLTAREFLQGIAGLSEQYDLEEVLDSIFNGRFTAFSGPIA